MSNLPELQKIMLEDLINNSAHSTKFIKTGKISVEGHLSILQGSVQSLLVSSLENFYPVILQLIGIEFFIQMARTFIKQSQPTSGNADAYGASFIEFIREYEPAKNIKYLPDVARLEWAMHVAYTALNPVNSKIIAMDNLPEHTASNIKLNSNFTLLTSAYPVLKIWQMHQPNSILESINLEKEEGQNILVLTQEREVSIWVLKPWQYSFINLIQQGKTLEVATAEILPATNLDDFQSFLSSCLGPKVFMENPAN